MKKIILFFSLIPLFSIAQVGIGTTDPRTTLDVNGAITNREVSFSVASNAVTIATETSLANITGSATATIAVTSFTPTVNGCRLIISNNTTGGFGATFAGMTIPNSQAVEFVYTNGGWKTTAGATGAANNIYNSNGTLSGNRTVTQGASSLTFTGTGNTILNSGNVGVGTTTPLGKLNVSGGLVVGSGTNSANTTGIPFTFGNTTNSAIWFGNYDNTASSDYATMFFQPVSGDVSTLNILTGDNASSSGSDDSVFIGNVEFSSGTKKGMTIKNGFAGIGNTTPNAPLQFASATANRKIVMYEDGNNDHQFYGFGVNSSTLRYQVSGVLANHIFYAGNSASASTELMRIQGDGKVAIGTAFPSAQFHTTGTVRFAGAGTPADGRSLVTDATGLATWQNPLASNSTSTAITASATQVAVPSTNVQGAISDLASAIKTVSSNDWKLDGNSNGFIKKIGTIDGFDVPFITSNTERMRILSSGNIGIGTTTAPHKLTISGNLPLGVDNGSTFQSKNASGTYENFLWPRWSDNIMYLNYGASGFNIRNNSSNPTMFMTNAGNVGIGTVSPNAPLQFATTTASRKIVMWEGANNDHQFIGFGVDNNVLRYQVNTNSTDHVFYVGSGATTSNELMRVKGTGNVGIGTSNPNGRLHLYETTGSTLSSTTGSLVLEHGDIGGQSSILFKSAINPGSDFGYIKYSDDGSGTGSSVENSLLEIGVQNDTPGSIFEDDIAIMSTGNVGIGTRTPLANFHTVGSVMFSGAGTPALNKVLVSDASGLATWQRQTATNTDSNAISASATQVAVPSTNVQGAIGDLATAIETVSDNGWKLDGNTNGVIKKIGTIDGFDVPFITSNTERMRILSSGNIGIGTTTAPHKLTISGNLPLGVDNGSTFQSKNASGTYENFLWPRWSDNIMYLNYGASGFNIRNNSSVSTMFMTNAGNVGIGTVSPNAPLQFANTIANRKIVLWEAANNDHQFYGFGVNNNVLRYQINTASDNHIFYVGSSATTSTELMRIQGNGNVGIGSTNPTKKLTVENGSIRPAVGNSQDAGVYFPTNIGGGGGDEAFIRYYVESGENTKLMIGVNNDADDDISFYQGGAERMNIYNGNVGIGTTTPLAKLDVTGIKSTGSGTGTGGSNDNPSQAIIPAGNNGTSRYNDWPAGWGGGLSTWDIVGSSTFMSANLIRSDFRLKSDIKNIDNSIFSNFMKIRPVTYFMKEQTKEMEGLQYGFIAQEIRDLFPSMVTKSEDPNGIIGMNYQALISPTIYVVQQQQAKIDELQKQVDTQNEKLSKMEEELKQIKQLLSK